MPSSSNDELFKKANTTWDLERLYGDLEAVKLRHLTRTEKLHLWCLLCGLSSSDMADLLKRELSGLRVDLSQGIFAHIKQLLNYSDRLKDSREIRLLLEQAGYQRSAPVSEQVQPLPVPETPQRLLHNLPVRDFSVLVGRDREFAKILEILSNQSAIPSISIEGIGGLGKTTLALAIAYYCLEMSGDRSQEPLAFDAIVFLSAKLHWLQNGGIVERCKRERSLRELLQTIGTTLNSADLAAEPLPQQIEQTYLLLANRRSLLIVDNLDTADDPDTIVSFLKDLPSSVKVLITSRRQVSAAQRIRLTPLSPTASQELIQLQAQLKDTTVAATEVQQLCDRTGGFPAAIVYAVGQLAAGYPLQEVAPRLTMADSDYARFYFDSSIAPLRTTIAHNLLLALTLFAAPATRDAIAAVAVGEYSRSVSDSLARLQQLSLIEHRQGRYDLLPLTREYAIAELKQFPALESQFRDRLIAWGLNFVQQHGGKDEKEWHDYSPLAQEWDTLQAAIEWCIAQNRYGEVRQFWQLTKGYIHDLGQRSDRLTCWATRLDWTDWLIHTAQQQQDWMTALQTMLDRAWTLTLLGQPHHLSAAQHWFEQIWSLRGYADSLFQADVAIHIGAWQIHQNHFEDAIAWLNQGEELLTSSDPQQSDRLWIQLLYYRGEVAYKTEDIDRAQALFTEALRRSQEVDWHRAIFLTEGWLADIAIHLGNIETASQLLYAGLEMAKVQQDECRIAFCKRSLARLEAKQGNWAIARRWAEAARKGFEELGMRVEAVECGE